MKWDPVPSGNKFEESFSGDLVRRERYIPAAKLANSRVGLPGMEKERYRNFLLLLVSNLDVYLRACTLFSKVPRVWRVHQLCAHTRCRNRILPLDAGRHRFARTDRGLDT
jgi:hypothetical protein